MSHLKVNYLLFVSGWTGLTSQRGDRTAATPNITQGVPVKEPKAGIEFGSILTDRWPDAKGNLVWAVPPLPITGNDKQNNNKQQFFTLKTTIFYFAYSLKKVLFTGNLEADKLRSELEKQQRVGSPRSTSTSTPLTWWRRKRKHKDINEGSRVRRGAFWYKEWVWTRSPWLLIPALAPSFSLVSTRQLVLMHPLYGPRNDIYTLSYLSSGTISI